MSDVMALAELVLVFGGMLAFCFWQLRGLRRLRAAREAGRAAPEDRRRS